MAGVGGTSSRLGTEPRTEWSEGGSDARVSFERRLNGAKRYARGRESGGIGGSLLLRFSRWFKIWWMMLGSVMNENETTRIRPPQFLQINGSVLNTRRIKLAHRRLRVLRGVTLSSSSSAVGRFFRV